MNPLLKMAILAGAPDLVQFHLQRGGDANHLDKDGVSPLMYAATRGQVEICRILLEAGADPFLKNRQGQNALALARLAGHRAVETVLFEAVSKSVGRIIPDEPDYPPESFVEEEEFDAFGWIAETETPSPEGDPGCLNDARALNQLLASHVPIDTDTDWSDVEIELPDLPARRRGQSSIDDAGLERIRHLLIEGIRAGRVSRSDLGYALRYDQSDLDGWEPLLDRVLGDLGVQIDDWVNEGQPPMVTDMDPEQEHPEELIADEALRFIEYVLEQRMDPANCYQRDLNVFGLLTAQGEVTTHSIRGRTFCRLRWWRLLMRFCCPARCASYADRAANMRRCWFMSPASLRFRSKWPARSRHISGISGKGCNDRSIICLWLNEWRCSGSGISFRPAPGSMTTSQVA